MKRAAASDEAPASSQTRPQDGGSANADRHSESDGDEDEDEELFAFEGVLYLRDKAGRVIETETGEEQVVGTWSESSENVVWQTERWASEHRKHPDYRPPKKPRPQQGASSMPDPRAAAAAGKTTDSGSDYITPLDRCVRHLLGERDCNRMFLLRTHWRGAAHLPIVTVRRVLTSAPVRACSAGTLVGTQQ